MLRSKHIIVTLCAVFLCLMHVNAQPRDSKRFTAIENEKIAYITKELNLTQSEAQRFFPLYNQYSKQMWALKSEKSSRSSSAPKGVNSFSRSGRKDVLSYDARELEVKKDYRKKFSQIIGNSRASQFFQIEQNFRELLYKELQRRNR